MKAFNLEKAKQGAKVVTRDGNSARIVCFDYQGGSNYDVDSIKFTLLALVLVGDHEEAETYTENGCFYNDGNESSYDLLMAAQKIEGWINIFPKMEGDTPVIGNTFLYKDIETAKKYSTHASIQAKIEWEE